MPDFTARSQPAEPDAPRVPSLTERITEILTTHQDVDLGVEGERSWLAAFLAEAAEGHYRPRVETVQQLDALPVGAVVAHTKSRDYGTEYRKEGPYVWSKFRDSGGYNAPPIYRHTPLYVLWTPGAGE